MSKIEVFEQGNLCIDYEILSRQCSQLNFKNGKVEYFSVSTQWDEADTIEEAIKNILEADKKYKGKAPLHYMIEEGVNEFYAENEHIMPAKITLSKDFQVSLDKLKQSLEKWQEEYGAWWLDILNGESDEQ